jgi:hypothetical protein
MKCRTPISVGELAFVGVEKNLSENTEIRRETKESYTRN